MENKPEIGARQIWETSLGQLELVMPRPSYDTWLKGTTGLSVNGGMLTVGVPTPFAAEWLERRMYQLIQRTLTEIATRPLQVRFQVVSAHQIARGSEHAEVDSVPQNGAPAIPDAHQSPYKPIPCNSAINPRYTFQNFVIGKCNQLAYAASAAVAQTPGEQYNPLFIYSGVGLGKTHLLHAIASAATQRNLHSLYVTTEQFTNDFIQAIRERKTEDFRARYRSADVLLLDDIQFLAGKEQTQEGFFHTFNDLHNSRRQIVVTCDRPPNAVSHLEDRLRSRFEWGLIADMQPPDLETRLAIIQEKAQAMHPPLPLEAAEIIVQRAQHSVRELEGCLNRVVAMAQFTGQAITAELAEMALADLAPPPSSSTITPEEAIAIIADHYHISSEAICTRSRDRKTTRPQRVSMYVLSTSLGQSNSAIAAILGQWNRKTVHNVVTETTSRLPDDSGLRQEVAAILDKIANPLP